MIARSVSYSTQEADWPVLVCVLGSFRLFRSGQLITMRNARKTQSLLCSLAIARDHRLSREALLHSLWPNADTPLASQSLNNLVYSLRKLLSHHLGGMPPILSADGYYELNVEAGIGLDVTWFEALSQRGEEQARAGNQGTSLASFARAVELYRGDLCGEGDVYDVVERERLRALYLTILAHLAMHYYRLRDFNWCLKYATRLLAMDPCREDAHRLVMFCHLQQGARAQALRQYRLCEALLRAEFDAAPEAATRELFDRIRLEPDKIQSP